MHFCPLVIQVLVLVCSWACFWSCPFLRENAGHSPACLVFPLPALLESLPFLRVWLLCGCAVLALFLPLPLALVLILLLSEKTQVTQPFK